MRRTFWLIVAFCIFLDQLSKFLVSRLMELGQSIPLIPDIFNLTYIHNYGASLSMLQGKRWFFVALTVIIFAVILYIEPKIPNKYKKLRISVAFFTGGMLGNFIDRLLQGYVVDFFDLEFWCIFNIADVFLTIAVILICFMLFFGEEGSLLDDKKKNTEDELSCQIDMAEMDAEENINV